MTLSMSKLMEVFYEVVMDYRIMMNEELSQILYRPYSYRKYRQWYTAKACELELSYVVLSYMSHRLVNSVLHV